MTLWTHSPATGQEYKKQEMQQRAPILSLDDRWEQYVFLFMFYEYNSYSLYTRLFMFIEDSSQPF